MKSLTPLLLTGFLFYQTAPARTLHVRTDGGGVPPYATPAEAARTVQAAVDLANDGDFIRVGPGTFRGAVEFGGKRVAVIGEGERTVLRGPGDGPVVGFRGTPAGALLDSVRIEGGRAIDGGGIFIRDAAPTIQRVVVFGNTAASRGAGVFVTGRRADPLIRNCVFAYNRDRSPMVTDAHQLFVDDDSSARIVNNTIVRGNGNGILLQPSRRASLVINNVIAWNGSRLRDGTVIGRGICDFSGSARIRFNVFFANDLGALLTTAGGGFTDFPRIADAQAALRATRVRGNRDGNPRLRPTPPNGTPASLAARALAVGPRGTAVNAGSPARVARDRDGSRNDAGHGGGPLGWR